MDVFGSSGVRGVVNESITPSFVQEVAQAAGTVLDADRVALARDTRATGEMLCNAAASGLASVGCSVDRLGIVPTPGLQAYAERVGVPGVMITASHNPPEYNGVKIIGDDGVELSRDCLETVEGVLLRNGFSTVPWAETGAVRRIDDACETYRRQLLDSVDRAAIADAGLTVALDPGHGAGALTSPAFVRELGCRVVTINAQPDGHFPGRDPEPVAPNLGDLGRFVRSTGADVGVAHDGDADRAIFVDEHGELIDGDSAFAALAAAEVGAGEYIVSAANASQRLVDVAREADADLSLTPIGSTHLITRIRELQDAGESVPIVGEGNGGIMFPAYRIARDGAYTAARFFELLTRSGESARSLVEPYDDYVFVRENVHYGDESERAAMLEAIERVARDADGDLDTTDGFRLDYGDGWVLARPSGTEPVIRIYAEARSEERAHALAQRLRGSVTGVVAD